MKVKYLKPVSSVLPLQTEPYLAGTKNQGASTETPTPGGTIGVKRKKKEEVPSSQRFGTMTI